jgi:pyrimidine operon attenuation protein/uracil phosphoribosyltransferase
MIILNHNEIIIRIERLACQIVEQNLNAEKIHIIGVEDRGMVIAEMINNHIPKFGEIKTTLSSVSVQKDNALEGEIDFQLDLSEFKSQTVIIIDDVLNSGSVMSAIFGKIIAVNPAKVQIGVLANRNHRSYPIHADIVGIDMATTLHEHIHFQIDDNGEMQVSID